MRRMSNDEAQAEVAEESLAEGDEMPTSEDLADLRREYAANAHLATAIALARAAQKLYAGRKMRAANELAASVVDSLFHYAAIQGGS